MTHTLVVALAPHASGLMSLQFRSVTRGACRKLVEVGSLYKRGLWVAPRIPNVNDERDPSVMKHNLPVRFSTKHQAVGGDHVDVRDRIRRRG